MSKTKRISLIILFTLGTPVAAWGLGYLYTLNTTDDLASFSVMAGVLLGLISMVVSAALGVIVSFFLREHEDRFYSLAGYFVPSILTLIYLIFGVYF